MGAIEALHEYETANALTVALREAAGKYHGAVGMKWLRLIVADRAKLAAVLADGIKQFVHEYATKDGQGERVARRFGVVAVAGEMATRYGLTGWLPGEAFQAVGRCLSSWQESFGGAGNHEERALLNQVQSFFEQHGASRFEDIGTEGQRVINRAGFFRTDADGMREYLVLPQAFRREVCAGVDSRFATRILREHGWILPGSDRGSTQKPRLPGIGPTRVYVVGSKMWGNE